MLFRSGDWWGSQENCLKNNWEVPKATECVKHGAFWYPKCKAGTHDDKWLGCADDPACPIVDQPSFATNGAQITDPNTGVITQNINHVYQRSFSGTCTVPSQYLPCGSTKNTPVPNCQPGYYYNIQPSSNVKDKFENICSSGSLKNKNGETCCGCALSDGFTFNDRCSKLGWCDATKRLGV